MREWIDLFRSLGEALLEVLRAELAALQGDLGRSGRHFGVALALFGGAAVLGFWIVGLILFVLVALLNVWLPLWGAALIVLGIFVLAAAILGWLGLRRFRKVENPITNVQRRVDDHLDWWQRLLAQPEPLDVSPSSASETPGRDLP
jgi:hypothetical protein